MSVLFPVLNALSVLFGYLTDNIQEVSKAAIDSAQIAVNTAFSLIGTLSLWSGLMKVAEQSGTAAQLAKLLSLPLRFLFGRKLSPKALAAITMNLSANLLGLGNAATPLGLDAMTELQKINTEPSDTASDDMILFTSMNTSSLQIIPTTIIGLRLACGSSNPMEILPTIWIVSLLSFTSSLLFAKLCSCKVFRR